MADEVIILDTDGVTEHVFPAGFDPKRAAAIVARQGRPSIKAPRGSTQAEMVANDMLDSAKATAKGVAVGAVNAVNPLKIIEGVVGLVKDSVSGLQSLTSDPEGTLTGMLRQARSAPANVWHTIQAARDLAIKDPDAFSRAVGEVSGGLLGTVATGEALKAGVPKVAGPIGTKMVKLGTRPGMQYREPLRAAAIEGTGRLLLKLAPEGVAEAADAGSSVLSAKEKADLAKQNISAERIARAYKTPNGEIVLPKPLPVAPVDTGDINPRTGQPWLGATKAPAPVPVVTPPTPIVTPDPGQVAPETYLREMGNAPEQMGKATIADMQKAGYTVPSTGLQSSADIDAMLASKPTNPALANEMHQAEIANTTPYERLGRDSTVPPEPVPKGQTVGDTAGVDLADFTPEEVQQAHDWADKGVSTDDIMQRILAMRQLAAGSPSIAGLPGNSQMASEILSRSTDEP